ncbi:MAG: homoserine kinase [Beijerinckiaceae bacterium]|jgi:homoserine kinase type II|nr:homoserine kinase [Beijerinckiaceae bacterium]
MAVYTEVTDEDLALFLGAYDLGPVKSLKGIAEGVENSNYLLRTEGGTFILTLYEKRVNEADLPFFLGLMQHLAAHGLVCPQPVPNRAGQALGRIAGRPAVLVTFLEGMSVRRPTAAHCAMVGEALARLHLAGADFDMRRANSLALSGWSELFETARARADEIAPGLAALIAAEIDSLNRAWPRDLPEGIIHADLFPDNVFFLGGQLSGLIDFYFACTDAFAYDAAICLNAWCFEQDTSFNVTKAHAFLDGYARVRPFTRAELEAFPTLARGASLRFLLTRLVDWLNVPAGAMVRPKDPMEYVKKLRFHQHAVSMRDYGWQS